ncbi:F0F1 ATP synthase subunit B [Thioalbus denitrificans]|jgi:F-type H+-transporting ATPase subunit b|uniref:ATP synthase subunit b n=1 Tax=Thioalbus denitrificans TaxID=547122 RepID=A0A369CHR2_9GAMM|nr:F0F1 ATP synthase subunit B [Thioalbus denitrificans]RCX32818.1 F-type H+-transporting ATPase subunit b [Thioalbus denitrificans]
MNFNATLIGQSIAFFVFVWFCMKFVWPPIMQALNDRKTKIADGLAAAERGLKERELAENHAKEVLVEAKRQAAEIISQAQKRGNEIVEEAKGQARDEGQRLLEAARSEIGQEMSRARDELRGQVVQLAVVGARKVLEKEVNAADHERLLKDVAAQL